MCPRPGLVLALTILALASACRRSTPDPPRTAAGRVPVVVATATDKPMPVDVRAVGP